MTPRKRVRMAFLFALFALFAISTVKPATVRAETTQGRSIQAVVTRVFGLAHLEPSSTSAPRQLQPFQALNADDTLRVKQGYVVLVCSDDQVVRLTAPKIWRLSAERCRLDGEPFPGLYDDLGPRLGRSSSLELAAVVEGGVRGQHEIREILLSPRDSAVAIPRPKLEWRQIESAKQYQIEIPGLGAEVWLAAEAVSCGANAEWSGLPVCQLPFPEGFSDLKPGQKVYPRIGYLQGLSGLPQHEDYRSTLMLLPPADNLAVEASVAALASLPSGERDALAGAIYAAAGLRSTAIQAYRRALTVEPTPEDRLSLGQLYEKSGLLSFAETEFVATLAMPNVPEVVTAAAAWGLARIAYFDGKFAESLGRAREAAALFRTLGWKEEETAANDLALRAEERAGAGR